MMKPLEALDSAISYGLRHHQFNRRGVYGKTPGAVIGRMGDEAREALSKLTSDELAGVRIEKDEVGSDDYFADLEVRKLKIAFDQKCKYRVTRPL